MLCGRRVASRIKRELSSSQRWKSIITSQPGLGESDHVQNQVNHIIGRPCAHIPLGGDVHARLPLVSSTRDRWYIPDYQHHVQLQSPTAVLNRTMSHAAPRFDRLKMSNGISAGQALDIRNAVVAKVCLCGSSLSIP